MGWHIVSRGSKSNVFMFSCIQLFITFYRRHNITHIGHFEYYTFGEMQSEKYFSDKANIGACDVNSYMAEFWNIAEMEVLHFCDPFFLSIYVL